MLHLMFLVMPDQFDGKCSAFTAALIGWILLADELFVFSTIVLFELEIYDTHALAAVGWSPRVLWYRRQSHFIEYKRYIFLPKKPDL
jgi:hypothetical protein